jgi:hypothetical protein
MKEIGVYPARPKGNPLDPMLAELANHDVGGAEVDAGAVMAKAKQRPDVRFNERQVIVGEVFGKVRVIGDHQG